MLSFDFSTRPVFAPSIGTASPLAIRRSALGALDGNGSFRSAFGSGTLSKGPNSFICMSSSGQENVSKAHEMDRRSLQQPRHTGTDQPRKREGKFASLLRKKDDKDLRRNAYLNRSRRAGDDRLFEARAEQADRLEWLDEQKEWQARIEAQHAGEQSLDRDIELEILEDRPDVDDEDMREDQLFADPPSDSEDSYFEYLTSHGGVCYNEDIQLPELRGDLANAQSSRSSASNFWSDDDDMERLLIEAATEIEQHQKGSLSENQDTDMIT